MPQPPQAFQRLPSSPAVIGLAGRLLPSGRSWLVSPADLAPCGNDYPASLGACRTPSMNTSTKAKALLRPSLLIALAIGFLSGKAVYSPSVDKEEGASPSPDTSQSRPGIAGTASGKVAPKTALLSFAKYGGVGDGLRSPRGMAEAMSLEEVKAAVTALENLDASPPQVEALKAVLERWAELEDRRDA